MFRRRGQPATFRGEQATRRLRDDAEPTDEIHRGHGVGESCSGLEISMPVRAEIRVPAIEIQLNSIHFNRLSVARDTGCVAASHPGLLRGRYFS